MTREEYTKDRMFNVSNGYLTSIVGFPLKCCLVVSIICANPYKAESRPSEAGNLVNDINN